MFYGSYSFLRAVNEIQRVWENELGQDKEWSMGRGLSYGSWKGFADKNSKEDTFSTLVLRTDKTVRRIFYGS